MQIESSRHNETNSLELRNFIRGILRQKYELIAFVVLGALLSAAYAFLSTPVYEAKAFVSPPSQNDIANFNYGRMKESELTPYQVKDVYEIFTRHLQAELLRRDFFNEVYLPSLSEKERASSQDVLYGNFSKVLRVVPPLKETSDRYSVIVQGNNPQQAKDWVSAFVAKAGELAKAEMIKNVSSESHVRARSLDQQISSERETSRKDREDSIAKLTEALKVAESIGLEKPPSIVLNQSMIAGGDLGQPIYMRGTKALRAEIENLQSRRSDDPFIEKLRSLQSKYNYFVNLKVNPDAVAVYRQDGEVELPDYPVKPNKALILILGVFSGLILGFVFVLFRSFLSAKAE